MALADLAVERPGEVIIEVEYRDRDLIRSMPGAKWIKERLWRVPLSWSSCLALRGVFGDRLEIGDDLSKWAWDEHENRVQPALEARELALDPSSVVAGHELLRPYQRSGVAFLVTAGSAVLADEMGTGKTVQTIMTLEHLDAYPTLIVAPKSVKRVWAEEFSKWAPNRTITVVDAVGAKKAKQLEAETDVLVVNWESLRTASRLAPYGSVRLTPDEKQPKALNRPWGAVVADEAHRAKDPKAKQTRALWAIGDSARHRYALTGTPVANTPDDFWALLRFVSPNEWPSRSRFIDRYCRVSHDWHGGISIDGLREDTKQEFFAAADPRFLRRPKALVLPHLPPKTYERRYVDMSPKQSKAYKEMVKEQVTWLGNNPLAAFDSLSVLRRLSQFASAFATVEDGKVTLSEPSSKVDAVMDLLEEMGDEPLVVFAESRQLIDLMSARMDKADLPYGRITGSENELVRDRAKLDFQDGKLRAILCTLGAGSVGLTLTRASTLCFMQRSFDAVNNAQAEDRVHRIGQTAQKVTIVDLIAPGTVEETVVLPSLEGKAEIAEEVKRDRELLQKVLSQK